MLENGIFLGSQILVPGMPMLLEMVILFDLLVVVACFGVMVRYLVRHVGSTDTHATTQAGWASMIAATLLIMLLSARCTAALMALLVKHPSRGRDCQPCRRRGCLHLCVDIAFYCPWQYRLPRRLCRY